MKTRLRTAALVFCCSTIVSCATGSVPHKEGVEAFDSGDYEAGIELQGGRGPECGGGKL
jgi:hypothetical protein